MEIIILVSVYLLSILFCRWSFKKISLDGFFEMLLCFFPLINILAGIIVFIIYEIENGESFNKISDWFFGIKEKD